MAIRLAITANGPYVGATTLGRYLEEWYGFQYVSMSETLIKAFVEDWNARPGKIKITTAQVSSPEGKAMFRGALQAYNEESGFGVDPVWVKRCLKKWLSYKPERDVVIEKVRTDEQAKTLRDMGFHIVHLAISDDERAERAAQMGASEAQVRQAMEHPVDRGISLELVDTILLASGPVGVYGNWLAHGNWRMHYNV